jgi:hypothetical protein
MRLLGAQRVDELGMHHVSLLPQESMLLKHVM